MAFAKLYEKENGDQLLVKLDSGDEGPEVRFFFEPKNLGVCSIALSWNNEDEDKAWYNAEDLFDKIDEEEAWEIVDKAKSEMEEMVE